VLYYGEKKVRYLVLESEVLVSIYSLLERDRANADTQQILLSRNVIRGANAINIVEKAEKQRKVRYIGGGDSETRTYYPAPSLSEKSRSRSV
jgi:hypothetical protein